MRTRPRRTDEFLQAGLLPEPEQSESEALTSQRRHETDRAYLKFLSGVATVADLNHLKRHGYASQIQFSDYRRAHALEELATNAHLDDLLKTD